MCRRVGGELIKDSSFCGQLRNGGRDEEWTTDSNGRAEKDQKRV